MNKPLPIASRALYLRQAWLEGYLQGARLCSLKASDARFIAITAQQEAACIIASTPTTQRAYHFNLGLVEAIDTAFDSRS